MFSRFKTSDEKRQVGIKFLWRKRPAVNGRPFSWALGQKKKKVKLARLLYKNKLLSVWDQQGIFFRIFNIYTTGGVQSKGMIESSLLSEDEPLTPNVDEVVAV